VVQLILTTELSLTSSIRSAITSKPRDVYFSQTTAVTHPGDAQLLWGRVWIPGTLIRRCRIQPREIHETLLARRSSPELTLSHSTDPCKYFNRAPSEHRAIGASFQPEKKHKFPLVLSECTSQCQLHYNSLKRITYYILRRQS